MRVLSWRQGQFRSVSLTVTRDTMEEEKQLFAPASIWMESQATTLDLISGLADRRPKFRPVQVTEITAGEIVIQYQTTSGGVGQMAGHDGRGFYLRRATAGSQVRMAIHPYFSTNLVHLIIGVQCGKKNPSSFN